MDKFFNFLEERSVIATCVLLFVCYITKYAVWEMVDMAHAVPPSLERAAVIAAILTPVSGLMAGAITFYNKRRDRER